MNEHWPELALNQWEPTYQTLHMWTQIVGKVRLESTPFVNHWWNATLYVTPRGLTTGAMPHESRQFSISFDFVEHRLHVCASDGQSRHLSLEPMTVADFYQRMLDTLREMGLAADIYPMPMEVPNPIPFPQDRQHASYDPAMARRLHQVLLQVDRVFHVFRGRFIGKCSPVHFFWGAFDLAVTRFSGRANPNPPPGAVMNWAYSHEVISHGFWPGGDWPLAGRVESPLFYAYAVPKPVGFEAAGVQPSGASYDHTLGEYVLPYDAVRTSPDPDAALLAFMQSTYEAGANTAGWDRHALELRQSEPHRIRRPA